jgi:hypothetical protein
MRLHSQIRITLQDKASIEDEATSPNKVDLKEEAASADEAFLTVKTSS